MPKLCNFAIFNDARGSLLPMAAVGMVILALLVGGGVDLSRGYQVTNRLQTACDAGVLAGRRAVTTDGFNETAQTQAEAYFATNYSDDLNDTYDTVFTTDADSEGATVTGEVTTKLDPAVMQIFGVGAFDLTAECSATMGVGNSDITFVLDTTGSMRYVASADRNPTGSETSRMTDLQNALYSFRETLVTATQSSNARIRYGFVPYSQTVNVGQIIADSNEDWLIDYSTIQSRSWESEPSVVNSTISGSNSGQTLYSSTAYTSSSSCSSARPATTAWINNGLPSIGLPNTYQSGDREYTDTTTNQPQRRTAYVCNSTGSGSSRRWYIYWYYQNQTARSIARITRYWLYHPVNYDMRQYKQFNSVTLNTGAFGAATSYTWAGCIEERTTVSEPEFEYEAGVGITPTANDLDIDATPDTSDPATQWRPMWPDMGYYRYDGSNYVSYDTETGGAAQRACPRAATELEELDEDGYNAIVASLNPDGGTHHDIGMLWGARLSSPDGPWEANVNEEPTNGGNVARHVIFMTDGQMDTGFRGYSAYGIEIHDQRITDGGSSTDVTTANNARKNSRFLAICEAIKGKGIRLWVIAFGTGLTTPLETCASPSSSFPATDSDDLESAFQTIARQVGELRVTQ